ncbi:MAG: mannose/fructose/sorbose PTS transporter subunit IIA [Desemzia incerta]|uniref:PTS system mannose-specific EIIAB component n=1 Tax=Desemzia incerta TaxID=82801 RepID=A0A1I5XSD4_9LACT|nr:MULTISPECIES: mannose/fructose/sorbose PTS transporter subunit IIA [Desemzia]MCI3029122.1 mannose/fructose/sorbose PTS transporter subunit IIA [Desemzia sp. C1]WHZ31126.1 mannose/fructose/sorbose PTS transporter subunit IIA [Desemzia incerta]SFQ34839.1 PTS system, mannose-specific IIB component [Desemzia incerta]
MVGIILASHGEFAEGILQSGAMIFGEQENVQAITLMPSEGPEDVRAKMEAAIASFDNQDEVLFLVDLWGGTPFNQANTLFEQHKDKWAIVAGLNLPMLIEAYGSRLSMTSAQEIASHIVEAGRDGVKVNPENLAPITATVPVAEDGQPQAPLAPNTVVGDGKIKFVLTRVDSRLLHGQVATAWSKSVKPNRIIVVSDSVANDDMRKKLIEQAAPPGVKANVIPIKKLVEISKDTRFGNTKALLLFENPTDVIRALDGGVEIEEVNVGSMAHSVGKVVVNKVLSMGQEDVKAFEDMKSRGIKFDVRKVPNDSRANIDELLKKAKTDLAKA